MSTTAPASGLASQPQPAITYAEARLWLGIFCVGFQVLLATTALVTALPERLLPALMNQFGSQTLSTLALFILLAATLLPFDVFGGYVLPRMFTHHGPSLPAFAIRLLRGITVQVGVFTTTFLLYQWLGATWGVTGVLTGFVGAQLVLLLLQQRIAHWTAGFTVPEHSADASAVVVHSDDSGFTGGITGLPWRDRIIVPAAWQAAFPENIRQTALERRRLIVASGIRRRGVIAAVLWNTVLLTIALWLPGGGSDSLVSLACSFLYYSLLSFGGLLLLPVLSRRAVFTADRLAADRCGPAVVKQLAACADQVPEAEPTRSARRESVFHPVPSSQRRVAALNSGSAAGGFWNIARTALYCSWAFGGPLSRSVHCNIGRPDLWVLLPTD